MATGEGGIGAGEGPIATKVAALLSTAPLAANALRRDTLVSTTRTANTKVRM
ncbi:MAG TPA: hypothetical protein VFC10_02975 [Terriglobia bacterium]|nr:hypothetical protein [Terriglobia bacterium]